MRVSLFPSEQLLHVFLPPVEYSPCAHCPPQVFVGCGPPEPSVPGGQAVQNDASCVEYLPASQFSHCDAPAESAYLPGMQEVHDTVAVHLGTTASGIWNDPGLRNSVDPDVLGSQSRSRRSTSEPQRPTQSSASVDEGRAQHTFLDETCSGGPGSSSWGIASPPLEQPTGADDDVEYFPLWHFAHLLFHFPPPAFHVPP